MVVVSVVIPVAPVLGAEEGRLEHRGVTAVGESGEFILSPELLETAIGRRQEITAGPMPGRSQSTILKLERFSVFAEDATIVVHTPDGDEIHPVPRNAYFKGRVAGEPGSTVVMTALESGLVRGLILLSGRSWVFSGRSFDKAMPTVLRVREVEPVVELEHDVQGFECGADRLAPPARDPVDLSKRQQAMRLNAAAYTARIAVETDNEFFNIFGNATDATNYVADLIAFGSTIYSAEVDTSWVLQHLSLWAQGQTDPWTQLGTTCRFLEFGKYWNDNNQAISRTTAAFFSGSGGSSGIAWVGMLCEGSWNYSDGGCPGIGLPIDNYAGAYAYIGGMSGNFDFDNPGIMWDSLAVAHEIGHNFDSPHTHCYANIGGNSNPIDQCYGGECGQSGCHCGGTGLPSDCSPGGGCGTIMSYCHLLSGGYSNISPTLGAGHPYGVEPGRVPIRMAAHVASQAASNPGCLDYVSVGEIFADDFDSGTVSAWSETVP